MATQPDNKDVLVIVVDDTTLDRARKSLATCERKLAEQTTPINKFYYEMCIKGWRRNIAKLEAEQGESYPPRRAVVGRPAARLGYSTFVGTSS